MTSVSKSITSLPHRKRTSGILVASLLAASLSVSVAFSPLSGLFSESAAAQGEEKTRISQSALGQIEALMREKQSRTPEQKKIDSQLLYRLKQKRGEQIAPGVENLGAGVRETADGGVLLDIRAKVSPEVLEAIRRAGGEVISAHEQFDAIRAKLPLDALETIAGLDEIKFIRPARESISDGQAAMQSSSGRSAASAAPRQTRAERAERVREQLRKSLPFIAKQANPTVNPGFNAGRRNLIPAFTGAVNSQGDAAHRADQVRALGINGNGVRIGVLSDGVDALAAQQLAGELPAVTVVPGQAGSGNEGTAMLEIIHDLAPGAQLFFARGGGGPANMANNIQLLAGAPNNCDIIVDDIFYTSVGVFQDDVIARAVNTVTAAGVLYFSSAGNAGNLNDGTAGVWEGDFVDGGTLGLLPGGRVHDFGGGVISNRLDDIGTGGNSRLPVSLKWSDPLGGSNNDYDLFILNPSLTAVIASSTNTQNGSQDPVEEIDNADMPNPATFNTGDRVVIFRNNGEATRALHLNTNRGELAIATDGQTFGHKAAADAFGVAATRAPGGGARFVGGATNPVETFSSDGRRRIFYDQLGNAITPGNVLFGTNGGVVRQKPDIAAADCVSTAAPGFGVFCGTSAAAPHAAAVAALVLSFNPALTPAQVRAALTSTALDIEAAGADRDSGAGIVMALQAIGAVSSADLAITKTDSPDPVVAGTDLTYTINTNNNGSGPAVFAQMQDPLPAGTRLQSFSGAAGWNCATPPIGSGGVITCRKDTLAVSESASFTVVVRVDAGVPDGATLTNTATISSQAGDPNGANNSATATTAVIARADLEVISKIDAPDPVVTNNPLTYTITLRNNGPSVATGVTLNDPLPAGALFNNCSATGGGVCGGAGQNRTVTFASLSVGAGATVTFETTANCALSDGSVISNTAIVAATTADPNPANNSASTTTVASNPPPVIICPPDRDVIAPTPGSTTAIVNFPDPMVTDNCPGVTVVCNPPSGSAFPLGVTTVNCTATDSGGATASCSFNVTVWDVSIQDDAKKDFILFNSFTGDYKFVRCGVDGFVMTGRGVVTRVGCITKLRDDTRVESASIDRCSIAPLNTGAAIIKRRQPDTTFILNDRNILNNSPTCP
ncbi:MAG TPA: S8 family serine peptidase [Blastocatellia bacterium]|nr:S8 family serine peptidase [Blastocatellia bacterium]